MTFGRAFFESLNYSSVNEDWRTEARGLALEPGARVLCITGSGDRPLDLLAVAPLEIVAIDASEPQNHLLRLKIAALEKLDYEEYAAFLGLSPSTAAARRSVWQRIAQDLPLATRAFWHRHAHWIERGVLYVGRFERYFRRMSQVANLLRRDDIETLFFFDDLEAQRRFVRTTWDRPWWRSTYAVFCRRSVFRLFYGDPAYYAHVAVPVERYLYDRMLAALDRFLARESFMMSLVLRGRLSEYDLPPYLTPEGCRSIRGRLAGLTLVDGDVLRYLEQGGPGRYTRFSLSDVPSYLDEEAFHALWRGVERSAAPGARIVVRQFLTRYALSAETERWFRREPALEAELEADDRAFGYSFIVGSHDGR